ncbi:putative photosynthetic complex assembly protein PuhE [Pseudosulfitobacter sp. SM2401]|uniref:putative photosynthetic complex assembly protein PuhE n=1 Tax=Pseudosulfitobacter sp. SM2401 TaxID=3350098 RepID=UPI0036F25793
MPTSPWIAAIIAVFAWWFFTGLILLVVRKSDAGDSVAHARSVLLGVPVLALGFAGLVVSSATLSVMNVYVAFLSVLMIWGWIELAFLAGIITGPETRPCPTGLSGWARFKRAFNTLAYHELLLLAVLLIVLVISAGAENAFGFWVYLVLFSARISAKLNLFFGVPRINSEFVPVPLKHLKSYFRQAGVTVVFPIGVTFLSLTTACFADRLFASDAPATTVGFALLTALAALAALEHWLMVIPLPDAKLWRWMLPVAATPSHHDQRKIP